MYYNRTASVIFRTAAGLFLQLPANPASTTRTLGLGVLIYSETASNQFSCEIYSRAVEEAKRDGIDHDVCGLDCRM